MSVESISLVLNHSKASGTAKLVLVGIANHDGDGGAWPSIATLARYANCSERSVQRAIGQLVDLGEVVVHLNAGGHRQTRNDQRPNRYDIAVTPVDNSDNGVTLASPRPVNGVTSMVERGDASVVNGVTPASPEPSLNHPRTAAAVADFLPVENLPAQVAALRAGFRASDDLDGISFARLTAPRCTQIGNLVDRHGVPRLVRTAVLSKAGKVFDVKAFLDTWDSLQASDDRPADVAEPVCALCHRIRRACEAADAKVGGDHEFQLAS